MLRSARISTAVASLCAVLVSLPAATAASATAAASPPQGTLTALEYKQLSAQLVALRKFDHNRRETWNQGYAACDKVGRSTALLRSIRTNCETVMGLDQALGGFYVQVVRCTTFSSTTTGTTTTTTPAGAATTGTTTIGTATGTTTTGTTTTGTTTTPGGLSHTDLQLFACLSPEYSVISRAAKSVYDVQLAMRDQVLARHFVGLCLLTLAPRHSDIELLGRFVSTAKQLAADVAKIGKIFAGTLPATALDKRQLEKDARAFSSSGRAISKRSRPTNLSVCPHQTA